MSASSLTPQADPHFRPAYEELLTRLLSRGVREVNERTGEGILAVPPVAFSLDLRSGRLPVCGIRRMFPRTAAAEVAWFLSGTQDVTWLRTYAPIWDKFTEDDGKTIAAAYGHRWRHAFGRDQLQLAVEALRSNSTDRRVYVSNWDPREDGLGAQGQRNVPCPLGFTLSVLDGELHSALTLRSSDVFVGLPYDVMGHALFMDAVASTLGLTLGTMMVTLAHPHLYEVHKAEAWDALSGTPSDSSIAMPGFALDEIEADPDLYVRVVKDLAAGMVQPSYHTRPEVVA